MFLRHKRIVGVGEAQQLLYRRVLGPLAVEGYDGLRFGHRGGRVTRKAHLAGHPRNGVDLLGGEQAIGMNKLAGEAQEGGLLRRAAKVPPTGYNNVSLPSAQASLRASPAVDRSSVRHRDLPR